MYHNYHGIISYCTLNGITMRPEHDNIRGWIVSQLTSQCRVNNIISNNLYHILPYLDHIMADMYHENYELDHKSYIFNVKLGITWIIS